MILHAFFVFLIWYQNNLMLEGYHNISFVRLTPSLLPKIQKEITHLLMYNIFIHNIKMMFGVIKRPLLTRSNEMDLNVWNIFC